MSATNRGGKRRKHDFYATPAWAVKRLLERVGHRIEGLDRALEPCAGNGVIARVAMECGYTWPWTLIELRKRALPQLEGLGRVRCPENALTCRRPPTNLIITNPPYLLAQDFIDRYAYVPVSFWLLRLNFLGAKHRAEWWKGRKVNLWVLPNRPPFALNDEGKVATDATEYAWFEFGAEATGQVEVLDLTPEADLMAHRAQLRARAA